MFRSRNKSLQINGCRPLRGLLNRSGRSFLRRTPQAVCFRPLRGLLASVALLVIFVMVVIPAFGQSKQDSSLTQPQTALDRDKYAVIINGASGEPAYAKQFQQWTGALQATLLGRFGFARERVKLLTEKPADSLAAPATADEVKKLFGSLRTELKADSLLFVFLIGHGSFDKDAKFNLPGPDLSAGEYNALLSSLPTHRIVVFNMASASGEFIKPLAAKGR